MGQRVEVDVVGGHGLGMGPRRRLDDLGVLEVRRRRGRRRELGRELPERQVLAAALDEAERGDVPEARGAPVAEHDLVAVGEREQLAQPAPQPAHHRLHRGLAVAGAEIARPRRRQRGDLLGADLRRTAPEAPVGGLQGVGDADVGDSGGGGRRRSSRVQAWQPWRPPEKPPRRRAGAAPAATPGRGSPPGWRPCPRRPPWPSTPRPRSSRPRGPTSSGSAPASPTSPRPTTSSRRPWRPATTRSTTTTRPPPGIAPLREAVAAKTARDSGYEVAASQVLVTNGAKQAVYEAFATMLDPGDEVLVPAPYWTTYPEAVALAGGVPVAVPTDESTGFHLTVDALEAAVTPATKVLLFVSPNNPTGAVSTPEEVARHRAVGRRPRPVGGHRRDLRAPRLRRTASSARCRWRCPSSPTAASSSTAWPRPTP